MNSQKLGIILGGLGLDAARTSTAINQLPQNVTLSFAAHSPNLQRWIDMARENGHEVLLELPMDSLGTIPDPMTRTLSPNSGLDETRTRLDWLLSRGSGYFAVMNFNGDILLNDKDTSHLILSYLSDAGLGFIFDNSFEALSLPVLATNNNTSYIQSTLIIDETDNSSLIRSNLKTLTEKAQNRQTPIGVAFAYDTSIAEITLWANSLTDKGIILAPVSHLMKAQ